MKFEKEYSGRMLKNKRNFKTQRKNSGFCKAHDTIIYLSYLFLLEIATFAHFEMVVFSDFQMAFLLDF